MSEKQLDHSKNEHGIDVWRLDGEYHREDGPAIIWANGWEFFSLHGTFADNEKQFYDPAWRAEVLMRNLK